MFDCSRRVLLLPFSVAAEGISDAAIAAIVVTANRVDIGCASGQRRERLTTRSKRSRKRDGHRSYQRQQRLLPSSARKVTPQQNRTSRALQAMKAVFRVR